MNARRERRTNTTTYAEAIAHWNLALRMLDQCQKDAHANETKATLQAFWEATVAMGTATDVLTKVTKVALGQQRAELRGRLAAFVAVGDES